MIIVKILFPLFRISLILFLSYPLIVFSPNCVCRPHSGHRIGEPRRSYAQFIHLPARRRNQLTNRRRVKPAATKTAAGRPALRNETPQAVTRHACEPAGRLRSENPSSQQWFMTPMAGGRSRTPTSRTSRLGEASAGPSSTRRNRCPPPTPSSHALVGEAPNRSDVTCAAPHRQDEEPDKVQGHGRPYAPTPYQPLALRRYHVYTVFVVRRPYSS